MLKPFFIAVTLTTLAFPAFAQEEPLPDGEVVKAELQEWVIVKQAISKERSDWEAEKEMLSDLNSIREKEITQLNEFIEAAGERITEVDEKRSGFSDEENSLKDWRRQLESRVTALEKQIRPLLTRLPPPLREKVAEAVLRLETPDASPPLQNRTRDVLLVLQATLEFQNSLTLDGDVREIEGERREIDILYLGLTQAWYADKTGSFGGLGRVTETGWEWIEENRLAPRIRKVIEMQQRSLPPGFVELPVLNGNEVAK